VFKAGALFSPVEAVCWVEVCVYGRNDCPRRRQPKLVVVLCLLERVGQRVVRTHGRPVAVVVRIVLVRVVVGRPETKYVTL